MKMLVASGTFLLSGAGRGIPFGLGIFRTSVTFDAPSSPSARPELVMTKSEQSAKARKVEIVWIDRLMLTVPGGQMERNVGAAATRYHEPRCVSHTRDIEGQNHLRKHLSCVGFRISRQRERTQLRGIPWVGVIVMLDPPVWSYAPTAIDRERGMSSHRALSI